MKRYPEYKNSQLDWVGEIPEHWKVVKFRYLSQESRRKNDDDIDREMLSLSSYTGIQVKQYESESRKRSKEESLTYLVVEPNQLVVNPMWQMRRAIGVSYLHGIVSPGYRVYYIDLERLIPQYLHYLMRSDGYVDEYNKHIRGLTTYDRSVKKEDFEEIGVLLPPKQEQTQIANFLDRKTEQIDELIHIKERRVELLQEQRTALIHETVTKGLDLNVEMKPSGVEYIGDIPKHWTITRLKYVSNIPVTYGLNIEPDKYTTNGIRFIRITDIDKRGGLRENGVYLSESDVPQEQILNRYDLLLCRSGATVGKSYLHLEKEKYASAGYLVRFNFGDYRTSKFIYYVTQSHFYRNWLEQEIIIATIQNVNGKKYSNFQIPFPLPQERTQIANFLDHKTAQIDELRSNEQRSVELLKEYRHTLISEVVTGKIDVRNEV